MASPFKKIPTPLLKLLCAAAVSSTAVGFCVEQNKGSDSFRRWNNAVPSLPNTGVFLWESRVSTSCEEGSTEPALEEIRTYQRMALPERASEYSGHAIFGLLLGEDRIESYEVFKRPKNADDTANANVLIALVKFGDSVDGHPGVVHGGILSLIFDEALGYGYEAIGVSHAVTANLNIDFRAPVPAGAHVRVAAQLEHREGRKLFWTAQMTSLDQSVLYAEAKSLYIIPKSAM
jgi:acyl-coenzyme A thioesterase PaaI-like protein